MGAVAFGVCFAAIVYVVGMWIVDQVNDARRKLDGRS